MDTCTTSQHWRCPVKKNLLKVLSVIVALGLLLAACALAEPVEVPVKTNFSGPQVDPDPAIEPDYSLHTSTVVEDGVEKVVEFQLVREGDDIPSTTPDFDGIIITKDGLYQSLPAGLFIYDTNWPDVSTFPKVALPIDVMIEISKEEGMVAGACSVVEMTTLYVFITCWPVP